MGRYYSGLIVDADIDRLSNKFEIRRNWKKIKNLPSHISEKILALPQFEIFFEGTVPYYLTQNSNIKKELPRRNGKGFFYDPVEDTEAYKLVIENVKDLAQIEYEKQMMKRFGTKRVFGGVHIYYIIESNILYEKYGIRCINNPMQLNNGLHID